MIKIIAKENGKTKDSKIGVNMTVVASGEIDIVTSELAHGLFEIWKKEPKIILKALDKLFDLIGSDLFNA